VIGCRPNAEPRPRTFRGLFRLTRYTIVSLFCLLIQNLILISSDFTGMHYQVAILLSTVILIPTGFMLQAYYTFAAERTWAAFIRYSAALGLNLPISMALAWVLCGLIELPMLAASPAISVILFGWNYFSSAWALADRTVNKAPSAE
jgi:putative flippase GtrA